MRKKTASRAPLRVSALLLLLLIVAPLGVSGCGVIPGLGGPSVTVPEDAAKALAEGDAKVKALGGKQGDEANRLRDEAANFYGAVAQKFAGTENGLRALLKQGEIYEKDPGQYTLAQNIYRSALRQYPQSAFPELHRTVRQRYDVLIAKMAADNRKTPYFKVMDAVVRVSGGNPVLAILLISVGVTAALWPLRAKQFRSFKEMQRHAPELKKIQEKYKDDRALQQEKVMAFYKEHGVNPMAGCLPMLAQAPILMGLYQVILHYQFEFAQSHFLWINPPASQASAEWPGPLAGSIARNLGEQDLLLLFIYALSMYFQTKLTPPSDPAQAEQQKIMAVTMPVIFFIMMLQWHLPSAFVLYWLASNVLYVAQQMYMNRKLDLPPLATPGDAGGSGAVVPAPAGGPAPNGGGDAKPLAPNARIISPKNRKRVRRK